jgi:SWI/SNF-related matrix-associated actin-dependent regulator of chromatin subfamily A3
VRYNVYVAADEWDKKINSFMTLGKSACLDVNIYFFGSLSNSLCAGKIMSDTGHFLQPPDFLDSSIPYENPHEISFPSMSNTGTPISVPMLESSALSNLSMDMMNTVLGRLDHLGDLEVLDVDRMIITTELKRKFLNLSQSRNTLSNAHS